MARRRLTPPNSGGLKRRGKRPTFGASAHGAASPRNKEGSGGKKREERGQMDGVDDHLNLSGGGSGEVNSGGVATKSLCL